MRIIVIFFACLFLASCGDSIKSSLDKELSDTDSIKVYFFNEKDNRIQKIVTLSEKAEINEVIASISDESSEQYKCGHNGQLEFYKGGTIIMSPQFNTGEGCEHYVFRFKDRMYHKVMTSKGKELLTNLHNN